MFKKSIPIALALPLFATSVQAQEPPEIPPTPYVLTASLDLECRVAQGFPPAAGVVVRQLNPVLKDKIPQQAVQYGQLDEACVPVTKNGQLPPPRALAVNRWVDLTCYDVQAAPIDVDVRVSHLNPQLAGLPDETVKLTRLEQVCLPVKKNGVDAPPPIKRIIEHFDFGCYGLAEPTRDAQVSLVLGHLNPVIQQMGFPDRTVQMRRAHQLCVPIAKDNQPVPPDVLPLIEWVDFLKYRVVPEQIPPILPLWLGHLNPLYAARPPFFTTLGGERMRLMVPVAKNGHLPPGAPDQH